MPKNYEIYCPKCDSTDVIISDVTVPQRVSMDELPSKRKGVKREFESTRTKEARCNDCGYTKRWLEGQYRGPTGTLHDGTASFHVSGEDLLSTFQYQGGFSIE